MRKGDVSLSPRLRGRTLELPQETGSMMLDCLAETQHKMADLTCFTTASGGPSVQIIKSKSHTQGFLATCFVVLYLL